MIKICFISVLIFGVIGCGRNPALPSPPEKFGYIAGGRVMEVPPDGFLLVRNGSRIVAIRIMGVARNQVEIETLSIRDEKLLVSQVVIELNLEREGSIHESLEVDGVPILFYNYYKMPALKELEYSFVYEKEITIDLLMKWLSSDEVFSE